MAPIQWKKAYRKTIFYQTCECILCYSMLLLGNVVTIISGLG